MSLLLRFTGLSEFPPSLYSDEINQGYNAYSILKTGRDEHGAFLPVSFRSFGDWKPPLQTYLMIPAIAVFGLTEFAVRLPNALLGVLSVFLTYLLVTELFNSYRNKEKLALLSAFFLSISPWHLHQSRSAMLIMVSLFFFMLGVYFFIKSFNKSNKIFLSVISFSLSIYSYYGMRLIIPVFCLFLLLKYYKQLQNIYRKFILAILFGFIFMLPLIIGYIKEPNIVFGRAKNVSVFFDRGVKLRLSELQAQDVVYKVSPKISLFFHNKPHLYGLDILKRFFLHFEGQFLFLKGDTASPFRIPRMGVLYLFEAILFPLGLFYLIKNKEKNNMLLIFWLLIAILPASLTFLTPAHNRSFNAVFPFVVISSYGVLCLSELIKFKIKIISIFLTIMYIVSLNFYLVSYYKILPLNYGADWLYGFKQLVAYLSVENKQFSKIIFLPKTGMSYIYILFYDRYPPDIYQKEAVHDYVADNLGFEYVKSFNKYLFYTQDRSWEILSHQIGQGEMYIGREEEIPKEYAKYDVLYPDRKVAFRITYL